MTSDTYEAEPTHTKSRFTDDELRLAMPLPKLSDDNTEFPFPYSEQNGDNNLMGRLWESQDEIIEVFRTDETATPAEVLKKFQQDNALQFDKRQLGQALGWMYDLQIMAQGQQIPAPGSRAGQPNKHRAERPGIIAHKLGDAVVAHGAAAYNGEEIELPDFTVRITPGTSLVAKVKGDDGRFVLVPPDIYKQKMEEAGKYQEESSQRDTQEKGE